ncbi:MAG: hypothetical protein JXB48_15795 [Candidatus Latescibacteria bacterium]|nr:hypothetical protein [Candidatus Latescibacterota bacterium]
MIYAEEKDNALNMNFPSKKCFIDNSIILTKKFLMKYGIPGVELVIVEKVMTELLMNVLKYGIKKNGDNKIFCKVENYIGNQLKIAVYDEGNGCNQDSLPENHINYFNSSYAFVKSICDQVEFDDKRKCVTVFMTVLKPSAIFS